MDLDWVYVANFWEVFYRLASLIFRGLTVAAAVAVRSDLMQSLRGKGDR